MRYTVEITDEALETIRSQAHYIASVAGAPINAARWLERVLDAADSLEELPRRFPLASEDVYFIFEIRACNIDGFLLLYTVDDESQKVLILAARHGRQQPPGPEA